MSMCIAIIPPKQATESIQEALGQYVSNLEELVPESAWHIPLVSITSIPSTEPLRQPFHQTVQILSLGEGTEKGQLWVRIQITQSILALRESLQDRIGTYTIDTEPFTPHIYLGSFKNTSAFGILDTPLTITCSIRDLAIIQTDPYEIIDSIPLTS